jgi:hypothetical protein
MGHLVAFVVHIPQYLSQWIIYEHTSHSLTKFVTSADTAVLLVILDVPHHF